MWTSVLGSDLTSHKSPKLIISLEEKKCVSSVSLAQHPGGSSVAALARRACWVCRGTAVPDPSAVRDQLSPSAHSKNDG